MYFIDYCLFYPGNIYIGCAHYGHNMTYIRAKKRKGKSGTLTYYYLVEGERTDGKVKQKIIKYLGTSPPIDDIEIEVETASQMSGYLFSDCPSSSIISGRLSELGISPPDGEFKEVSLVYSPPRKKLFIRLVFA